MSVFRYAKWLAKKSAGFEPPRLLTNCIDKIRIRKIGIGFATISVTRPPIAQLATGRRDSTYSRVDLCISVRAQVPVTLVKEK
jgi:hypothetical protein